MNGPRPIRLAGYEDARELFEVTCPCGKKLTLASLRIVVEGELERLRAEQKTQLDAAHAALKPLALVEDRTEAQLKADGDWVPLCDHGKPPCFCGRVRVHPDGSSVWDARGGHTSARCGSVAEMQRTEAERRVLDACADGDPRSRHWAETVSAAELARRGLT